MLFSLMPPLCCPPSTLPPSIRLLPTLLKTFPSSLRSLYASHVERNLILSSLKSSTSHVRPHFPSRNRPLAPLPRLQHLQTHRVPLDVIRFLPCGLLASLPLIGYVAMPLIAAFPHVLLPRQFHGARERRNLANFNDSRRQRAERQFLEALRGKHGDISDAINAIRKIINYTPSSSSSSSSSSISSCLTPSESLALAKFSTPSLSISCSSGDYIINLCGYLGYYGPTTTSVLLFMYKVLPRRFTGLKKLRDLLKSQSDFILRDDYLLQLPPASSSKPTKKTKTTTLSTLTRPQKLECIIDRSLPRCSPSDDLSAHVKITSALREIGAAEGSTSIALHLPVFIALAR